MFNFKGLYAPGVHAVNGEFNQFFADFSRCEVCVGFLPRLTSWHEPHFIGHALGLGRAGHLQMPHVNWVESAADDADLPCWHGVVLEVTIALSLPQGLVGFVHGVRCLNLAQGTCRLLQIGNVGNCGGCAFEYRLE